ncbi:MAG: transcriptional repressor [Bacillota bacterium]|nr:transcriptional repressor [Bacillota bacterium]
MNKTENSDWPAGIKRTKQREQVFSILTKSDGPLSAMDICSLTQKDGNAVWLSTVYRILELFTQKALVVKTSMQQNDMAVYELNRHDHKHYAVCVGCNKIIPIENCPIERFIPEISDSGFHVLGHKMELFGYCRECDLKHR